jgi:hypothetical protein
MVSPKVKRDDTGIAVILVGFPCFSMEWSPFSPEKGTQKQGGSPHSRHVIESILNDFWCALLTWLRYNSPFHKQPSRFENQVENSWAGAEFFSEQICG